MAVTQTLQGTLREVINAFMWHAWGFFNRLEQNQPCELNLTVFF